jgi:hypothetical protein
MNAFKALNPRATRGTTAAQSCRMLTNRERPKVGSGPSREHVAAPPKYATPFSESLAFSLVTRPYKTTIGAITTRRTLYWLAAMVVLLVVGTIIGLIWADTSDVAGAFAGVTNIVSGVGIVLLLIALAVKRRRRPS